MFVAAEPKFSAGEKVRLRHKVPAYWERTFGHYSKGHEFTVVGSFVDMTAVEYRNAADPKNMEDSFQIPLPEFIYELRDDDGRTLRVYESELKRQRRSEHAAEGERSIRPAPQLVDFPLRNSQPK